MNCWTRRGFGRRRCSKSAPPTPASPPWTNWRIADVILARDGANLSHDRGSPFEILELNERGGTQSAIPQGEPFYLYQHQVEAMGRAGRRQSYVVTSGTGSGKSLTYFLPIIDAFLRHPPPPTASPRSWCTP